MIENKSRYEWQLSLLATSLTRAMRLEKHREDFHEELYSLIIYPSFQLDPMAGPPRDSSTDGQAIRIIELKERYDKKIQKEYRLHLRWQNLLLGLDYNDQQILIRYFQKKKYIQPRTIRRLLDKIQKFLDAEESKVEKERDERAATDYKKHQKQKRAFRSEVKPLPEVVTDKQQYLVGGQFVFMTPEEYPSS